MEQDRFDDAPTRTGSPFLLAKRRFPSMMKATCCGRGPSRRACIRRERSGGWRASGSQARTEERGRGESGGLAELTSGVGCINPKLSRVQREGIVSFSVLSAVVRKKTPSCAFDARRSKGSASSPSPSCHHSQQHSTHSLTASMDLQSDILSDLGGSAPTSIPASFDAATAPNDESVRSNSDGICTHTGRC